VLRLNRLPRGVVPLHTEVPGFAPPDAFGPFRVLHQIGAGTLGPVFRAYDSERDRLVAVKLFRLDLPPERMHQLVAEFEPLIADPLSHPTIAAPRATGTDGITVYLAWDFVAGDSLDVVVRDQGPAPPADSLRVASQLAGAIDLAAAAGVYHGALHPRDVLIASDEARLTGLGIAQALEKIAATAPIRLPYTAPERIAGIPWDRRADIYSLAALIHELIRGRRLPASGPEAAAALTPRPGWDHDRLRAAFVRALALERADRFETAADFVAALQGALSAETVVSQPSARSQAIGSEARPAGQIVVNSAEPALPLSLPETDAPLPNVTEVQRPPEPQTAGAGTPPALTDSRAPDYPIDNELSEPLVHEDISDFPSEASLLPLEAATTSPEAPPKVSPKGPEVPDAADLVSPGEPAVHDAMREDAPEAVGSEHFDLDRAGIGSHDDSVATRPDKLDSAPAFLPALDPPAPYGARFDAEHLAVGSEPAPLFEEHFSRLVPGDDEPSPSRKWPVAAALIVGLIIGFGGGYAFRGRPSTVPSSVVGPSPAASASSPATRGTQNAPAASAAQRDDSRPNTPKLRTDGPVDDESSRATQANGRDAKSIDSRPGPGRLLVRSSPAGAQVLVDDKLRGVTPATIRDLSTGAHQVRITREGYVPEERRVVITGGQPSQSLSVDLQRTPVGFPGARRTTQATSATNGTFTGALSIDSRPAGAQVLLDGKPVGTTPMEIAKVDAGDHVIRLELDGYRLWTASVRIAAGERHRVTASLER
jgi:serine/threonine protein kinase